MQVLNPQPGEIYRTTQGYAIFQSRQKKSYLVTSLERGSVVEGNLDTVRKLWSVSETKRALFRGKRELLANQDPSVLQGIIDLPHPNLDNNDDDTPRYNYRVNRPDQNEFLHRGMFSKDPLYSCTIGYHVSGTRKSSPYISSSTSALWPVFFATAQQDNFTILEINPALVKGYQYRLDTDDNRRQHLNMNNLLAVPNAKNAKEIVYEAYFPPESFTTIKFDKEVVQRFSPPKRRQTLVAWVATLDDDCLLDLRNCFGGRDIQDLM